MPLLHKFALAVPLLLAAPSFAELRAPSISESSSAASSAALTRALPPAPLDPCWAPETVASPSRPYWDAGAATTPCGNIESDFGVLIQPIGAGINQRLLLSSIRYGLTPKLDLRWGVTNHISQSSPGVEPIEGIGDQSISFTYRFREQGRFTPALALSYGFTVPTANPGKGFGSGFTDHQFLFIASRDLRQNHLDFNIVGTIEREPEGREGAAQFGLAITRPITPKLALILESYGGPQPDSLDKFGAVLTGASYSLRSWLVLDAAFTRTYTAGSPRRQTLFGFTCARRPGLVLIPKGSRIGRLLGR